MFCQRTKAWFRLGLTTLLTSCVLTLAVSSAIRAQESNEVPTQGKEWGIISVADLFRRADIVFLGKTESTRSFWNETRTMIFTEVRNKALSQNYVFKGALDEDGSHILTRPGGQVGNIRTDVSHQAPFSEGDRALLFLYANERPRLDGVVGGVAGKVPLQTDPRSEREFLIFWRDPQSDKLFTIRPSRDAKRIEVGLDELPKIMRELAEGNDRDGGGPR